MLVQSAAGVRRKYSSSACGMVDNDNLHNMERGVRQKSVR